MDELIIYTCITNSKDNLKEYIPEEGVRYICFTDGSVSSPTKQWELKPLVYEHECPTKTARFHKTAAHAILPDHKWSIWMDGHLNPMVKQKEVIDFMGNNVMGVINHGDRKCIYEEMVKVMDDGIEHKDNIEKLFSRYKEAGFPSGYGLHRTGVLVRKNTTSNKNFNELWWKEILDHSKRDQLSFDYVRWMMNYVIKNINISWYNQTVHKGVRF